MFAYLLPGSWRRVQEVIENKIDVRDVIKRYGSKEEYLKSFASRFGFVLTLLLHTGTTLTNHMGSAFSRHNVTVDGIPVDLGTATLPHEELYIREVERPFSLTPSLYDIVANKLEEGDPWGAEYVLMKSHLLHLARHLNVDERNVLKWFAESALKTYQVLQEMGEKEGVRGEGL